MENYIFWSEIASGFGQPGGTSPPRIPRSTPPRGFRSVLCLSNFPVPLPCTKKCFCKVMKKISKKCYRGALNMIILFGGFCRHDRIKTSHMSKTWKARLAQLFQVSFHVHPSLPSVLMPKFVFNFNDTLESSTCTLSVKNFSHLEEGETMLARGTKMFTGSVRVLLTSVSLKLKTKLDHYFWNSVAVKTRFSFLKRQQIASHSRFLTVQILAVVD